MIFFVILSVSGRRDEEAAYKLKYGLYILHTQICNLLFPTFRLSQLCLPVSSETVQNVPC